MNRPQLHLTTDTTVDPAEQVRRIDVATRSGVDAVHVRLPRATAREMYDLAMVLQASLVERGIPLIVNDRVDVALAVNAGGIQLGARSLPVRAVRRILGPDAPVGVSVHSVEGARQAEAEGATWVTFGHVYETASHPGEKGCGIDPLREVAEAVQIPVIAIGGITADRASNATRAGASGVAVISGILRADDVAAATREYRKALDAAYRIA